jgi:hypothetical protein
MSTGGENVSLIPTLNRSMLFHIDIKTFISFRGTIMTDTPVG